MVVAQIAIILKIIATDRTVIANTTVAQVSAFVVLSCSLDISTVSRLMEWYPLLYAKYPHLSRETQ